MPRLWRCRDGHQRARTFIIDLPEIEPKVTRYVSESGYYSRCGRRVRSRHREQISTAIGAAGVMIGPQAKAFAADLKHRLGVPFAKVCEVLEVGFPLRWRRSGACQADARRAEQARPVYEERIERIRQCVGVHADETGGRIGILSAWLWVFTNQQLTVYTIQESRGHDVVVEILGKEFAGILSSDCFSAYDHKALSQWLKQKCLGHILKDLSEMVEEKGRGAVRFAQGVMAVLRAALALRDQKAKLSRESFASQAAEIEQRLDALIDEKRRLTDPDNQRLAKRLRKQREHLLRFLYVDGLDATNNQAERMRRPAVITRKTSFPLQQIACFESGRRQFNANVAGGTGDPYANRTGAGGIMQLLNPPATDEAVWNWHQNITEGLQTYGQKLDEAVALDQNERRRLIREPRQLGLPNPVCPAGTPPPLSVVAGTGGHPRLSQVERDAIRRYNCGLEYRWEPRDARHCAGQWVIRPSRQGCAREPINYITLVLNCQ